MPPDPTIDAPQEAVLAVATAYETAFNTNDAAAMNALFTEDTTFVNFNGNLVFGAGPLHRAQAFVFDPGGALEDVYVRYLVEAVAFPVPECAIVHLRQRSSQADGTVIDAAPDPMEGILTLVLVRGEDDRWRIRAGQNTPVSGPPPQHDGGR